MIGLDDIVGVLLKHMPRTGCEFIDHARVDRRPVGGGLHRSGTEMQRAGEEHPRRRTITAL